MRLAPTLTAASLVGLLLGCETPTSVSLDGPDVASNLPPADVHLPPVPPLDLLDLPQTYEDGSYSVIGVLLNREPLREQFVRITAVVQEIYRCQRDSLQVQGEVAEVAAPVPEGSSAGENCLLPHFFIVDNLRSERRLLVVTRDLRWEAQLRPGQRYVFAGRYAQQAPGHMSPEDGLLVLDEVTGEGITPPTDELPVPAPQ